MTNTADYWQSHVEAIEQAGCSASGYAKRHGLAVATLYYWQRKLRLAAEERAAARRAEGKFIAFTVLPAGDAQPPAGQPACTLLLAGGITLELPTLPDPSWLLALSHAASGRR